MRIIARHYNRPTDTSKDVEYTDWADVESFVDEFLQAAGIAGSVKEGKPSAGIGDGRHTCNPHSATRQAP
jgi:hypothetical protein